MSDLGDWVESLKRAVAPLGQFKTVYASATDDDVAAALADGFAEAQLDGFFTASYGAQFDLDVNAGTITPDLTQAQGALVVIYAAVRLIQARLLNLQSRVRYQAGPVDYETEQAASILTTLLKQFNDRIALLREKALYSGVNAAFHMADGYFLAATRHYGFAGDGYNEGYGSSWSNDPNFG